MTNGWGAEALPLKRIAPRGWVPSTVVQWVVLTGWQSCADKCIGSRSRIQ
nr:MAG TPA: hypothetical protein [Caudoviricetes sp.]